jgi:hypothetical protein
LMTEDILAYILAIAVGLIGISLILILGAAVATGFKLWF